MAQALKVYAPTPAQSLAAARGVPVSKVASLDSTIDETTANSPAAFDTEFVLRENFRRDADAGNTPQQNLPGNGGRLSVSSHEFTALLEHLDGSNANDDDPNFRMRRIGGIITKAIKVYETNSKVIHGKPDVPGTELSIRL